jgi:hypothetical protein
MKNCQNPFNGCYPINNFCPPPPKCDVFDYFKASDFGLTTAEFELLVRLLRENETEVLLKILTDALDKLSEEYGKRIKKLNDALFGIAPDYNNLFPNQQGTERVKASLTFYNREFESLTTFDDLYVFFRRFLAIGGVFNSGALILRNVNWFYGLPNISNLYTDFEDLLKQIAIGLKSIKEFTYNPNNCASEQKLIYLLLRIKSIYDLSQTFTREVPRAERAVHFENEEIPGLDES